MSFVWLEALWLFCLLPCLALAYVWLMRRRRSLTLQWPSLSLVTPALGRWSWWRHAPAGLLLLGLAALVVAVARPIATTKLFTRQQTVLLVMDVSASMQARDVLPDRLSAAQSAAKAFVTEMPEDVRVGVVSYGGTAHLVQAPTRHRDNVIAAIDGFRLQPGTAIGNGLMLALATVFPNAGLALERFQAFRKGAPVPEPVADVVEAATDPSVQAGSYDSAVIMLLSDGQNTTGVNPLEVADAAAKLGIKVYTVGFGTRNGDVVSFGGWALRVRLDEETLNHIATVTGGEYFYAANGNDLKRAYQSMHSKILVENRETELAAVFSSIAAVLVLLGVSLSLWQHRASP